MKSQEISITDAEWEVMESVWQAPHQTPAEILGRIDVGDRSHRTLRTLLARLVEKGAITVRVEGAKHLYSAGVSRESCIRTVARSFSQRFFAGNLNALLLHFVKDESLTADEIQQLKQQLDKLPSRSKSAPKSTRRKRGS